MTETRPDPAFDYLGDISSQMEAAQAETANQVQQEKGESPSPAQGGVQASAQRQGSQSQQGQQQGQQQRNGNETPAAQRRWLSFAEAMSLEIKAELVKGLIPACGIGQLWGESGAFKTFIAMMLGYHVSEGLPLCGKRVLKKPVYYLLLEGANGLPKRTRALFSWHKKTHVDKNGNPIPLTGVYRFWPYDFNLSKNQAVDAVIDEIKANKHEGALVVIDTQSQASIGIDENVAKEITQILGAAKRISEEINGVVLLIHHTGKDATKKQRGSYAQEANIDFSLEVEKGADCKSVLLKADKEKDHSKNQCIQFNIEIWEIGTDNEGEIITSCVAVPSAYVKKQSTEIESVVNPKSEAGECLKSFILAMHETKKERIFVDEWRPFYYSISTADPKSKKTKFHRARKKLVELGVMAMEEDFYFITPDYQRKLQTETAAGG